MAASNESARPAADWVTEEVFANHVGLTANAIIFPLFGWPLSLHQNLSLGLIYTAISIARSYCIRRWFNRRLIQARTQP